MGVNKIVVNKQTVLDLTGDSVTPQTLAVGATAHDATGEQIEGALNVYTIDGALSSTSTNPVQNKVVTTEINSLKESKADQSNVYSKTESDSKYQAKGNYLTSFTETDPTVPAWAKKSTKPSYTASEVGADASGTAESKVSQHNASTTSHSDIRSELSEYQSLTLGVHSDGKIYIFKNGSPIGSGVEAGSDGDVVGYIDSSNNIVLSGTLPDSSYTVKYEMNNGTLISIGSLKLVATITNNLTYCTNGNSAKQLDIGSSYSATLTASSGYTMKSITVTMGGTNITSSAVSGNKITISKVTGDVVITAVAEQVKTETNFAQYNATNTSDWEIWINNARVGSDGKYRSDTVSAEYGTPAVSNWIEVQKGDYVEFTGMYPWNKNTGAYNSSKGVILVGTLSGMTSSFTNINNTGLGQGNFVINDSNVKYIRLGGYLNSAYGDISIKIKRNGEWL